MPFSRGKGGAEPQEKNGEHRDKNEPLSRRVAERAAPNPPDPSRHYEAGRCAEIRRSSELEKHCQSEEECRHDGSAPEKASGSEDERPAREGERRPNQGVHR